MHQTWTTVCIIMVPALLAGCADPALKNELRQTQEELRHLKEMRAEREGAIESAYETYDDLMRRFIAEGSAKNEALRELAECRRQQHLLESRVTNMTEQQERFRAWAKEVVAGYGPSIWMMSGEHDLPLFRKTADASTVRGIIDELNLYFRRNGNPTIIYRKTEDRTVHVGVSDDMKLAAQMGSYGAAAWIRSVTFSLASLGNVDCIELHIEEGDHAGPGTYCPLGR